MRFGRHGPRLLPAGAEFLEGFEGFGDRGLDDELFGFLAELYFLLKVLFLVEGAEFPVYLEFVEELLNLEVVVLPEVVHLFAWHFADGFPSLLYFVEALHGLLHLLFAAVGEGAMWQRRMTPRSRRR